jgi:hypothetical protein
MNDLASLVCLLIVGILIYGYLKVVRRQHRRYKIERSLRKGVADMPNYELSDIEWEDDYNVTVSVKRIEDT